MNILTEMANRIKETRHGTQILVWLGIAGMVLILLSECIPAQSKKEDTRNAGDATVYQESMEAQLTKLIGQIDGAGKTSVMITLETGEENVYALDIQEGDGNAERSHILLENGDALKETIRMPSICGVAVVCEGGDDIHVVSEITNMLSSLLGISTNRISVAKMS